MSTNRRDAIVLRGAGERLVAAILADEELVNLVVTREIEARVRSGDLVPKERLTMGPGLEVTPMGTVAGLQAQIEDLESAIDGALDLFDDGKPDEAAELLAATIPDEDVATDAGPDAQPEDDVVDEDEADEPEVADEPEEAEEPAPVAASPRRRSTPEAAPAPDDPTVRGRPEGFPGMGQRYQCQFAAGCETMVPGATAQLTWTRTADAAGNGLVLCREHVKVWTPSGITPA